jgi:predicted Zn-ribbon and HTH transcriptional regulator
VATAAVTSPATETTLARARSAGGPIDNASYACACGFVFAASVSTTVRCPHCGADQAW